MKNEKTSKATLAPVVFVSPEALKEVKAQRNPNDLIIMNAQTDLCGRKLALIPVSEIDTEMIYQRKQTYCRSHKGKLTSKDLPWEITLMRQGLKYPPS